MRDKEEFRLVSRRKKRGSCFRNSGRTSGSSSLIDKDFTNKDDDNGNDNDDDYTELQNETLFRRLCDAEDELKNSAFLERFFENLTESLDAINVSGIAEILCYGLGRFAEWKAPKYQLALLKHLKEQYGAEVHVYDPAFSAREIALLKKFHFRIIEKNEEGKRAVNSSATLVYMPHCSIHLINNFLYANWGERLTSCVLVTNSFSSFTEISLSSVDSKTAYADYVSRVLPYVTEITLRNDFICEEAFNDLNIHIFLKRDLEKAPPKFWTSREEPCYRHLRVEFITIEETDGRNSSSSN